jgi:hypothetical protein
MLGLGYAVAGSLRASDPAMAPNRTAAVAKLVLGRRQQEASNLPTY